MSVAFLPTQRKSAPHYPAWADTPYWEGFYLYSQGHSLSELPSGEPAMARGWWAALEAEAASDETNWRNAPGYEYSTQPYLW